MPRPRKEDARDTRELALQAAHDLLHRFGYLGVSMDAVADAIGVRKASLYHHFPDGKEALVLEIAGRAIAQDAAAIAGAITGHADTRGRLRAVAACVFAQPTQTGRVLRDALRFMAEEHQRAVFADFHARHYLPVRAVLDEGVARGELRPHDTARSAWAFLDLLSETGAGGETPRDGDAADWIVSLLIDGLRA